MKNKNRCFILIVISISVIMFGINALLSHKGNTVYIYYESELYETAPLDKDCEINVNGTNTVVIENNQVYMKDANCPDKLCIHQGRISDSGRDIICLPNKIIIKVGKTTDIDAVSQ